MTIFTAISIVSAIVLDHRFDAELKSANAQRNQRQEMLDLFRNWPEAIDQFLLQAVDAVLRFAVREPLVDRQPLVDVAAEIRRQQGRHMQVDFSGGRQRRGEVRFLAGLQRFDGGIQHVGIQLEADLGHFAGLAVAKHFAGTADLDTKSNLGLAIRLRPGESINNKRAVVRLQGNLALLFGPSVSQVFAGVANDEAPGIAEKLEQEFLRLMDLNA